MPASDVYSWAKASKKPSYAWTEISSKPIVLSGLTNIKFGISSSTLETYIQFIYNSTGDFFQITFKPEPNTGDRPKIELGKRVNNVWTQIWVLYS